MMEYKSLIYCFLFVTSYILSPADSVAEEPVKQAVALDETPMPEVITIYADRKHRRDRIPNFHGSNRLDSFCRAILADPERQTARIEIDGTVQVGRFALKLYHLRSGDIVPLIRSLYRVESMVPGEIDNKGFSEAEVTLHRVDDPPEKIKLTLGTCAFPFVREEDTTVVGFSGEEGGHDSNRFQFRSHEFWPWYVPGNGDEEAAVRVDVLEVVSRNEIGRRMRVVPQTVRVGDFLKLGDQAHRIVKIVPPDSDSKVMGWFEFNLELEPADTNESSPAEK